MKFIKSGFSFYAAGDTAIILTLYWANYFIARRQIRCCQLATLPNKGLMLIYCLVWSWQETVSRMPWKCDLLNVYLRCHAPARCHYNLYKFSFVLRSLSDQAYRIPMYVCLQAMLYFHVLHVWTDGVCPSWITTFTYLLTYLLR